MLYWGSRCRRQGARTGNRISCSLASRGGVGFQLVPYWGEGRSVSRSRTGGVGGLGGLPTPLWGSLQVHGQHPAFAPSLSEGAAGSHKGE